MASKIPHGEESSSERSLNHRANNKPDSTFSQPTSRHRFAPTYERSKQNSERGSGKRPGATTNFYDNANPSRSDSSNWRQRRNPLLDGNTNLKTSSTYHEQRDRAPSNDRSSWKKSGGRTFHRNPSFNSDFSNNDSRQNYNTKVGRSRDEIQSPKSLFFLRHSYGDKQTVELRTYNDSGYGMDTISKSSGGSEPFYIPHLSPICPSNQDEINDLSVMLQSSLTEIKGKITDSTFNHLNANIRYGLVYVDVPRPFVDQMPAPDFKKHLNQISPSAHGNNPLMKRRICISTGFSPINDNYLPKYDQLERNPPLILDNEEQTFTVVSGYDKNKIYQQADYNNRMELIRKDNSMTYLQFDIRNSPCSPDVQISITGNNCQNGTETVAGYRKNTTIKKSTPILQYNRDTDDIVVAKEYGDVRHVRCKKTKFFKLSKDVEIWEALRQNIVIEASDIIEYSYLDRKIGRFNRRLDKAEINIRIKLNSILRLENLTLFAENLHKLIFITLPKYFVKLNQYGHQIVKWSRNWNPKMSKHGYRQDDGKMKLLNGRLPHEQFKTWKLVLLRHSSGHSQKVKFYEREGFGCNFKINYKPLNSSSRPLPYSRILPTPDTCNDEIEELSTMFQLWIGKVVAECSDPSVFDNLNASIRCGRMYLAKLQPFVTEMPITQFKERLNSRQVNPDNRILTGFTSNCHKDLLDYADLQEKPLLVLDHEEEIFRIAFDIDDYRICAYADCKFANDEIELISYNEDRTYLKFDVKNSGYGKDFRISFIGNDYQNTQDIPSKWQDIAIDKCPIITRDKTAGDIIVGKAYTEYIRNVRRNRTKYFKFSAQVDLSEDLRQLIIIQVTDTTNYSQLDKSTGRFKKSFTSKELNVKMPLNSILQSGDCHMLAQNLHKIMFTILPEYLVKRTLRSNQYYRSVFKNKFRKLFGNRGPSNRRRNNTKIKFLLLRHSYMDYQIVEFHEYDKDACYRMDRYYRALANNSNPFYAPHITYNYNTDYEEINELSNKLQKWISTAERNYAIASKLPKFYMKLRYGHVYLTELKPYTYRMTVEEFKEDLLKIMLPPRRKKKNSYEFHRTIRTGFYPAYENYDDDIAKSGALVLDHVGETYRIAFNSGDSKILDYADFNDQMELIANYEDKTYLKLDIKNSGKGRDARISIHNNEFENEKLSSKMFKMEADEPAILTRDRYTDHVMVGKVYTDFVYNVRHKKARHFKLSDNVPLWDKLRQAITVRIADVVEYFMLDRSSGRFHERHEKVEVNIRFQLDSMIRQENCRLLAENLHKLMFTILPRYLSSQ
ncbi:uncharacterized protein TRIADDRAFT_60638 [Trichoplax adhaerens]|uniref:Uncharacterized protein n=1 Tax=Trichoplax adhaerens TaxID=10228 RepID=B3S8R8_TRIAD|nr:predicted protein [Trichoplax adhaerens]EDV20999.1 predicted protein [Trichoplax adhaerens]|eukprot:XP_002116643.1 predicted protein [Trichoplax adhaerens]